MKKVVCPKCGGPLTLESLCQYGLQYEVCKNGKVKRKSVKVDHGPMDYQHLFCKNRECRRYWPEDEFEVQNDRIVFLDTED